MTRDLDRTVPDAPRAAVLAALAALLAWWASPARAAEESRPHVYVPYRDLSAVIDPARRRVLMDRDAFQALLAKAQAAQQEAPARKLAALTRADYVAEMTGDHVDLRGRLTVDCLSDEPTAVPFPLGRAGWTEVSLNDKPAPLGVGPDGTLRLIVAGRGRHTVRIAGRSTLSELPRGGLRLDLALPPAAAGALTLHVQGDQDVHANVPVAQRSYDADADRTSAILAMGGQAILSAVLTGNGRQDDRQSIVLGESVTTVALTPAGQQLHCVYTVQMLRQGRRELTFSLPTGWHVADVACPDLVGWSVTPVEGTDRQHLAIRLRVAREGTQVVRIQAIRRQLDRPWTAPAVHLVQAEHQRGYLQVDPGRRLRIRRETLTDARREDPSAAADATGLAGIRTGRLFFHWGEDWQVSLGLAEAGLTRSIEQRQTLTIDPKQLRLDATFQVTPSGREMYELAIDLPPADAGWQLDSVRVDQRTDGFDHAIVQQGGRRYLRLELANAVRPESVATVAVGLTRVPARWNWPQQAPPRDVQLPLVSSPADSVTGIVAVRYGADLAGETGRVPDAFEPISVGRMASLGLGEAVTDAWRHRGTPAGGLSVTVRRLRPRVAVESVALVSAGASNLNGTFRLGYTVSRAHARRLYLLADRSLGRRLELTCVGGGHRIVSRAIIDPGDPAPDLSAEQARRYHLWQLELDAPTLGKLTVQAQYQQPIAAAEADHGPQRVEVPLVRPLGTAHREELLAVQADEELAVTITTTGTADVDAIDLPALPQPATRILSAYRLLTTGPGAAAGPDVILETVVHDPYALPVAVAREMNLQTVIGADGAQRTQADVTLTNAGLQFLVVDLPQGAQLWSVIVAGQPAKPQGQAADRYLVPVGRSDGQAVPVRIVYAWTPPQGTLGRLPLGAVQLPGVEINQVRWSVAPPPGYHMTGQDTHMQGPERTAWSAILPWLLDSGSGQMAKPHIEQALRDEVDVGVDGVRPTPMEAEEKEPADTRQKAPKRRPQPALRAEGRYTLPIELALPPRPGMQLEFTGLGRPELTLALASNASRWAWLAVGSAALALAATLLWRAPGRAKALLVLGGIAGGTLLAVWWPPAVPLANGVVVAALLAGIAYVARWVLVGFVELFKPSNAPAAAGLLTAVLAVTAHAEPTPQASHRPAGPPSPLADRLIVPYQGPAATAHRASKVLVPYERYVRLWNQANPDDRIALPDDTHVALAGVRYEARVEDDRLRVRLTARVQTRGRAWAELPLPIEGLAVISASFDGAEAKLRTGPKGLVLSLPGQSDGPLVIEAVGPIHTAGRRGSIDLRLPPLPGSVMALRLPEDDLHLKADSLPGGVWRQQQGKATWVVPLGLTRTLSLSWTPRMGAGAADRTLSARVAHDLHVFHWAMIGVSRVSFDFSGGRRDRFGLLIPEGITLTGLEGANLRDARPGPPVTRDGQTYTPYDIRLHRPAEKDYPLTVRWLGDLPPRRSAERLWLPRSAEVGRESVTLALHAAGGVDVKVDQIAGGRRVGAGDGPASRASDTTRPVGRYAWPFRSDAFDIRLRVARRQPRPTVQLDQLLRIERDRLQLLARIHAEAVHDRLFASRFALPDDMEIVNVAGADVEDWFVRDDGQGRQLLVNYRRAVRETSLAVVLLRESSPAGQLDVPRLVALDDAGRPLADQSGRLAVQLDAALDAKTLDQSQTLRPVPPSATDDWLGKDQARSVRFAYRYQGPRARLALGVRPLATSTRVEIITAVTVQPSSAWTTCRLRYHIDGSPRDRLRFSLPTRYAPRVAVSSPAMRSVTSQPVDAGRTEWNVALAEEVTGTVDVVVNFTLPIDPNTRQRVIPEIRTDAPAGYRQVIAVQNASRHELSVASSAKLSAVPVSRQSTLLDERLLPSLQMVQQSFEPGWSLTLGISPAPPAARIQAVVDLLELTSIIDRDGTCRYHARVLLQNRSEQFLRVAVPEGLALWSAQVAGQAVKPVLPGGQSSSAAVLVPLVKTSPGGLPYEVYLVFGGTGPQPLSGITKLTPPAIGIEGIPVQRTTWSLQLPPGYRYLRPGGNMDPVAGTAEMLSIGIDARLDQLRRLAKSVSVVSKYDSAYSTKAQRTAGRNFERFNRKVTEEIAQAKKYVESNRRQLDEDTYQRLQRKLELQLGGQRQANELAGGETAPAGYNVNAFVNDRVDRAGTSIRVTNGSLRALPGFVARANEDQLETIQEELSSNVAILDRIQSRNVSALQAETPSHLAPQQQLPGKAQPTARSLLRSRSESRRRELGALAEKLASHQQQLAAERQSELARQITDLKDNRLSQVYRGSGLKGTAESSDRAAPLGTAPQTQRRSDRAAALPEPPASSSGLFGDVPRAGVPIPSPDGRTGQGEPSQGGGAHATGEGFEDIAVAGGTYSLALAMPDVPGATRLDFARPGGGAEVTVWAVPARLPRAAWWTAVLVALVVLATIAGRLVRRIARSIRTTT